MRIKWGVARIEVLRKEYGEGQVTLKAMWNTISKPTTVGAS